MRVELLNSDKTAIDLRTIDAPANAPEWLSITPGSVRARIVTFPIHHAFDGSRGDYGEPKELVDVVRRYLVGDIDQETAEGLISAAIERWCKANKVTS